ncbi:MAG TPA: C4-dicarboxylate ABC transporter permease, partial [Desulfobacteraceae bacterium]|nr:C4-dicarboxylate ABC transporter permease [Desulfobacteraceae bacterium]
GAVNWCLAALSILPPLYIVWFHERLTERLEFVDDVLTIELILGGMMILLLLEAVRRAVVPAMAFLIAGFFLYLFAAPYLPGVFYAKPVTLSEIIEMQYLITDAGIFGSITGVSATFVALFVIFGAFMEATKTGQFFTDLACRVAGKSNGGPAKIAVISSGLFGSISGVAAANVYSTGVFTIPLMKQLGYRKRFAGAVEAAASTGGMLMPPVMGAGAFVMAEITGISYVSIVIAAMLGSLLLYASMVVRVHYTALKNNLSGVSEEKLVPYKQILRDAYLLLPMILLVVLLLKGYSPFLAANAAIAVTFVISFVKKDTRMTPARIWETLRVSAQNMVMIALACAGAGMVVAIVTHTGLALGIATVITNWSGGQMLPALLLIMVTSLVMGMGLPCTPAYIIAITIGGPALLAMGAEMLSAHLFVYYFAVLAGVTPPVCVPAFCAAAIARSKPLQTGFEAFKLAMAGFLIPYVFVYNPALLMQGSPAAIITVCAGLMLSIFFFAGALSGYFFTSLGPISRLALFLMAAGVTWCCAIPNLVNSAPVRLIIVALLAFLAIRPIRQRFRTASRAAN